MSAVRFEFEVPSSRFENFGRVLAWQTDSAQADLISAALLHDYGLPRLPPRYKQNFFFFGNFSNRSNITTEE